MPSFDPIPIRNASVAGNIERKSSFVDKVALYDGKPLFSWIDINPTELCNRTCAFCPRHDPAEYPNQNLHMTIELGQKMAEELASIDYQGAVTFSGYGEPLLHPEISDLIGQFTSRGVRTEVVTNGDPLTPELIQEISGSGPVFFVVSMYDGMHQKEYFQDIFNQANIDASSYLLRDRWYDESSEFGLKLTNRAGVYSSSTFSSHTIDYQKRPCFYPSYSMTIDWNGDVLLCVQDWNKRVKFGNLNSQRIFRCLVQLSSEKISVHELSRQQEAKSMFYV